MNEYVQVFGNIVIVIDVLLLIIMIWCVSYNFRYLMKYDYDVKDVNYRVLLLAMCSMYSMANVEALMRHINTFLITRVTTLSNDMADSLLSDRGYMFGTACFMLLFTIKFVPTWFVKFISK